MGSCASSEPAPIWSAIGLWDIDGLVLLGDTPYIDSRDLSVARRKHREFLLIPELAVLLRDTPTWGTWDDHDFGGNDTDGRMTGKENTRRAFVEYRAHTASGDGEEGVYTSFRRGPLEVFLLDPRYFARTSEDAAGRPTLLGDDQWEWLERGLRASTAAFKAIACGMIWDDKKNSESDDWGSYPPRTRTPRAVPVRCGNHRCCPDRRRHPRLPPSALSGQRVARRLSARPTHRLPAPRPHDPESERAARGSGLECGRARGLPDPRRIDARRRTGAARAMGPRRGTRAWPGALRDPPHPARTGWTPVNADGVS